jgi:hypothetical protein
MSLQALLGSGSGVSEEILTENLNMRCIAIKFIPQLLTNDPKQQHVNMHLER